MIGDSLLVARDSTQGVSSLTMRYVTEQCWLCRQLGICCSTEVITRFLRIEGRRRKLSFSNQNGEGVLKLPTTKEGLNFAPMGNLYRRVGDGEVDSMGIRQWRYNPRFIIWGERSTGGG